MSKRFWLLGFVGLILVALLVACGSSYNSSTNGLILVGSQGSSVIQTFSLNPGSGHVGSIANSTNDTSNQTCLLNGSPASMVMTPSGAYAYVIFNSSSVCSNATKTGIAVFQVKSDGTTAQVGDLVPDGNPISLAMDSAGKFLFVAEGTAGLVNVYAIGSDGGLTGVTPTFNFVNGQGFRTPNIVAVAPTPTVFPKAGINGINGAVCSAAGDSPPTAEYLYAVDADNYVVWEFSVDMTTGALGNLTPTGPVPSHATDAIPAGAAVDACNRFLYVSGSLHNKVNAYVICTTAIQNVCPSADGSLVDVAGSPFAVTGSANGLGPIVVDPNGNDVYVLGTLSYTVSGFKISPVSGGLIALSPATVATGTEPKSIAIRADNNWMFVTNYGSASVSQYAITPATGVLTTAQPITTDNYPFGVAVK